MLAKHFSENCKTLTFDGVTFRTSEMYYILKFKEIPPECIDTQYNVRNFRKLHILSVCFLRELV